MYIWSVEQEGEELGKRFAEIDRAGFARLHNISGGASMIYQHITARRPMSIKAAVEYAAAFNCPLEEISPRIALEVAEAARFLGSSGLVPPAKHETPKRDASWLETLSPSARRLAGEIATADKRAVSSASFDAIAALVKSIPGAAGPNDPFDVEAPSP
ncbi:hypothetical protein [Burkholderia sp. PU8-34]